MFAGLAVAAAVFFVLPVVGLLVHSPWSQAWTQLHRRVSLDALRLSLVASIGALVLSFLFGMPLAWVLSRAGVPARRVVRGLVLLPMVLPPVVAGIGLFTALGRRGILGGILARLGVSLAFTPAATIIAAAFVSAPFLIVVLEAAFSSVDRRLEDAAATLGATRARILARITFPAVRPSLWAGGALCWARALGEFGATITFAGNLEGRTQTLPLAVYQELQTNPDAAIMLSVLLLAVSLAVLVALRGNIRLR